MFGALFAYPAFLHLLPRTYVLGAFAIASYLILLDSLIQAKRSCRVQAEMVALLGLVPMIVAGIALNRTGAPDNVVLAMTIVVAAALSWSGQRWIEPAVTVGLIYALVHCAATLGFFAFPNAYPVVRSFTNLGDYPGAWDYRSALTGHYSYNAMYCALALILATGVLLSARSKIVRRAAFFGLVIALLALILTSKRAHLVFAVAGVVVMLGMARRQARQRLPSTRRGWPIALSVILGTAAFMWTNPEARTVIARFAESSGSFTEYSSGRTGLWSHAVDQWQSSPIFGIGWSGYQYAWVDGGLHVVSVGAHNVPLQLLAETGVFGVALFVSAYCLAILRTMRSIRRWQEHDRAKARGVLIGSLGIQVFFGFYALVGNPLYDPPTFTAYLLAVSAAACTVVATGTGPGYAAAIRGGHQ